ncbi:hypothetical protein DPSP01_011076 [Paraphaeosphaeria sporulosa]
MGDSQRRQQSSKTCSWSICLAEGSLQERKCTHLRLERPRSQAEISHSLETSGSSRLVASSNMLTGCGAQDLSREVVLVNPAPPAGSLATWNTLGPNRTNPGVWRTPQTV